ncbi:hypothetical protein PRIPAC_90005 [Pristionchus pacificus]|uniref:SHSP domain-containing protein n=1 Tax=Pristionchus pacificus TaxID=54126 RepID=A0A454Y2J6_PRIPA|nr:hypothetical protein PRIPAC_90005 [Pristionchus pacificus]|eukprot:PDM61475.1 hypothetical protein PRIPAC_50917 [Pristionchus pacificus]
MSQSPSASPTEKKCLARRASWDWPLQTSLDGEAEVHSDDEKFEVHLDASHFCPSEIKVKVIGRLVDIHAEHKALAGPIGDVERSYNRTYKLPDDVNEASVKSWLSPRGYLVITAHKKTHVSKPPRLIL